MNHKLINFKVILIYLPMTITIKRSIGFVVLVFCVVSDLVIRSPASLKKYFDDKYGPNSTGIPYSLANFGDVPYGRSIVG